MKKPPPLLTPRIIADLRAGDECADPDHSGLRVRRTNSARVFFYRYRASDGALREIKLGEFGPMTLGEARKAFGRLKLDEIIRPMLKRAPRGGTYLLSRIRCAYAHAAEQGRIPDEFAY